MDLVVTELAGAIRIVRMSRPERKNAMGTQMLSALLEAVEHSSKDDSAAMVITGSGGVFSSGADVTEEVGPEGAVERMRMFCRLYESVLRFPKPVVAAVVGHCIGGGAEVASACDLRVGGRSASFKFPGAIFGIPVGSARLPALVGVSHAKDLLMTARSVTADEAYRMGLLNRLVDDDQAEAESVSLAEQMGRNPGAAAQKRRLDVSSGLTLRTWEENRALVRWQSEADGLMGEAGR